MASPLTVYFPDLTLAVIVAICPTYRREHLIPGIIAQWRVQKTEAKRLLLILDDGAGLEPYNEPGVVVLSLDKRFEFTGAKFAFACELAIEQFKATYIIPFLDDDVYLPGHVEAHWQAHQKGVDFAAPTEVFSNYPAGRGKVSLVNATGRFHGAWGFSASAYQLAGGYPKSISQGYDFELLRRLNKVGAFSKPLYTGTPQYIYRWQTVSRNTSAEPYKGKSAAPMAAARAPIGPVGLDDEAVSLLDAVKAHEETMRAPSIFVSIASFCDPHLQFTLDNLFEKAANPQRISVGVVNQTFQPDPRAHETRPYARQVRYVSVDAVDSRGVCWARSIAGTLYRGEDFILQIDSHTWFRQGWDSHLVQLHHDISGQVTKPVLSTYPPGFEFDDNDQPVASIKDSEQVMALKVHEETRLEPGNPVLRFKTDWVKGKPWVLGFHLAGGFLFARGAFVGEVPYDPNLYFHGEEQSLATRAWTRGWNIVHPRMVDVPLYHLYKQKGKAHEGQHWRKDLEARRSEKFSDLTNLARARLSALLYEQSVSGDFGLGGQRTLAEFVAFSGIDYLSKGEVQAGSID